MISASNPGPFKTGGATTGRGKANPVGQLPSMPPRPYTPGKSGPFIPSPKPGTTHSGQAKKPRMLLGEGKVKNMRKGKDRQMRHDRIKAGLRKGGPSKAQLSKIRLGAMKLKNSN